MSDIIPKGKSLPQPVKIRVSNTAHLPTHTRKLNGFGKIPLLEIFYAGLAVYTLGGWWTSVQSTA